MAELQWLSSFFLGTIFIVSGAIKLVHRVRFRDTLAAQELLSRRLTGAVAGVLPPLELAVGAAVLAGWRLSVTGPFLLALLLCFLVALTLYRLRGGMELVCGCFADFEHKTTTSSLILRNVLLLVSGLPLLRAREQLATGRSWEEWLMAATAGLGVVLVWIMLSRLFETISLLRAEGGDNS